MADPAISPVAEPRVSVALCTHNGAAYVEQQVASILAQRPAPFEIVLGDDASTDDTVAIVERSVAEARAGDPAVRTELVVHRRAAPLGVVGNFAATLAECRGEILALSDQDDVWPAGRLGVLVAEFADDALLLVHSDARLVDADGSAIGLNLLDALEADAWEREHLASGDALPVLLRRNLVTGATVVFRARLRDLASPFPADWVHDEWLAAIAASVGRMRLLARPLLDYRQHGANQIGARKPTAADRWRKLREPRAGRAVWLARRADALAARARELGATADVLDEVDRKAAHESARAQLPRFPLWRVPGVVGGVLSGRYGRYSRGVIDVVRDLVAPAGSVGTAADSGRTYELRRQGQ